MATRYYLRVLDTTGALVALLTTWRRLDYTNSTNSPDSYVLELDDTPIVDGSGSGGSAGGAFGSGAFGSGAFGGGTGSGGSSGGAPVHPSTLFSLDCLIEVWREDRAASPQITRYLDFVGFHRTSVEQTLQSGLETFTSYGAGMTDLLARRGVWYPAQSAGAMKSGPGETVMKAFVNENAGPGATVTNGRQADGVTPLLTVAADTGRGAAWSGSREQKGLLETLQEIAVATRVDFGVVRSDPDAPLGFLFQAKPYPWGQDRTATGLNPATGLNASGNVPVVLSVGLANMGSPVLSLNRGAEINAVLILGQGLESAREVLEVTDPVAVAASPWNRHETSKNANMESTTAGLQSVGDAALADLKFRESFSFNVLQRDSCRYGRDYFTSDLITARYHDTERNYQIKSVNVVVQAGSETISVTVSNVPTS